jgi:hypothetical protein
MPIAKLPCSSCGPQPFSAFRRCEGMRLREGTHGREVVRPLLLYASHEVSAGVDAVLAGSQFKIRPIRPLAAHKGRHSAAGVGRPSPVGEQPAWKTPSDRIAISLSTL